MANWDYTITQIQLMQTPPLDLNKPKNQETLNTFKEMGSKGWELFHIIPQQMFLTCFWKKEIKKGSKEEWNT